MQSRIIHTLIAVVFIGTLVSVAVLGRRSEAPPVTTGLNAAVALHRYGFYLTEVSRQAGVNYVHQEPALDPKLSNIMPLVASMGASVTIVDYNNDGWPDIYVTNSTVGGQNHLYRNNRDGTFTDVAPGLGLSDVNKAGTGVSMGAVWGDYDNDGYDDLLLYKWGKPELFHNDHGRKFTPVSVPAMPKWMNCNSATWVDYDRDGKLDLLLCGYYPDNVDLWHLKNTRMMPNSFEYADNGGRKYLLRNLGGGKFEDVTKQVGLDSTRWTLAVGAADLTGSGYPDLVLANDYGVTQVYENEGGKHFREIGRQSGIGYQPKSGMNVSFGDILNSGQESIYVSNISSPGNLVQGNNLWVPDGTGSGLHYSNWATDAGVEMGGWSFGAQFGDLSNDGDLDIVLANGNVSASRDQSYWYDYSKIAGGNGSLISDAANWPPIGDKSLSGYETKHLWLGDGTGRFTDAAQSVGFTDTEDGRAVALADLWNTGALDVIVANQNGRLLIYRNTAASTNGWVEFHLTGTRANRDAFGAEVTLYWRDAQGREHHQLQTLCAASGFCAQNDRRVHFGLGPRPTVEKVVIRWPSPQGATQTIPAPPIDRVNQVTEPL